VHEIALPGGDEIRDLGLVGVTNDEGNAGEGSEFFGSALSVTASDEDFRGGILRVDFADGVASLRVRGGGDRAGVDDDEFSALRRKNWHAAAVAELALDGCTVGLRGTTAKLLDVESGHG